LLDEYLGQLVSSWLGPALGRPEARSPSGCERWERRKVSILKKQLDVCCWLVEGISLGPGKTICRQISWKRIPEEFDDRHDIIDLASSQWGWLETDNMKILKRIKRGTGHLRVRGNIGWLSLIIPALDIDTCRLQYGVATNDWPFTDIRFWVNR